MEEDMYDINFIPDYDPSSESQSEDWIVIDEAMSENGEAHQKEEERSPKDIPEARTVKLTEPAVRPPVVPDVKAPIPTQCLGFHALTHILHTPGSTTARSVT